MNGRQRRGVSLATLLATLAGVSLILMTLVLGAGASTGTTISSTSTSTTVGGSSTTTITANLSGADAGTLFGFDITLHFNPAIATAVVTNPTDYGSGWSQQLVPGTGVDNGTGVIHLVAARFTGCGASCPLFTIHWTGVAAGSFNITLTEAQNFPSLGDQNGVAITWDTFNQGTVTVNGPTNTPVTPSNTPVTPSSTPVTPSSTPVTPSTTPVTPSSTPVTPSTTPVTPPTQTNTPTATSTGTITPQPSATGTGTPVPTSTGTATGTTTPTATPTINRGPLVYKLYLPEVADDGIPGSSQLVRDLGGELVERVLRPLTGANP